MFYIAPNRGNFTPWLTLRSRRLRGSAESSTTGEYLRIQYQYIIPGFDTAYWQFYSLAELETCIKAHLCLYSLMAPIIESGIQRVFGTAETKANRAQESPTKCPILRDRKP